MVKIAVIIGSTRPNRFGPQIATWLEGLAASEKSAQFSTIDLSGIKLPMLDEPKPPMAGDYQNAHTKEWAKVIEGFDGFLIVTPEYNAGYPASLKNALDFLYAEWNNKPVAFASYGASAGGSRAVAQLRPVVANLKMFALGENVTVTNYWAHLDENGTFQPEAAHTESAKKMLASLTFWAVQMREARTELAKRAA